MAQAQRKLVRSLGIDGHHIRVEREEGIVAVRGEVPDILLKKRALKWVRGEYGPEKASSIVDDLLVAPGIEMDDHRMLSHLRDALLGSTAFRECLLRLVHDDHDEVVQSPEPSRGEIIARITNGIVELDGRVPSLVHRRLAGVFAWWIPGTRDVRNCLEVSPPEADGDDQIREAVSLVLETDPMVDADQLGVKVSGAIVTLGGMLRSEEQRAAAERDALFTLGVEDVVSEIEIDPLA